MVHMKVICAGHGQYSGALNPKPLPGAAQIEHLLAAYRLRSPATRTGSKLRILLWGLGFRGLGFWV